MFHSRLKTAVKSSHLIVKEIAAQSGVSRRTIEKWLSNNPTMPRVEDAVAVANVLGVSVEFLVTGQETTFLPIEEINFLTKARRWRVAIEDLELLSPSVSEGFCTNLHAVAEEVRNYGLLQEEKPQVGNQ